MRTFNTYFSTTQYPFIILYLPTKIQMNFVYRKTGFKHEFSRFLMYKYVFIVFFDKKKKTDAKIYIYQYTFINPIKAQILTKRIKAAYF